MAITQVTIDGQKTFKGLSTDTKATTGLGELSTFWETDSGFRFVWNGAAWVLDGRVPQRGYEQTDTEVYKTDGYSGTDADVDDTERFGSDIDLELYEGAALTMLFNGDGATDDLRFSVYKRDDATWEGDEKAIYQINMGSDGSEDVFHYTIEGRGHYRIGLLSTGATDTFEVDLEMRRFI